MGTEPRPLLVLVDLQRDYLNAPQLEPAAGAVIERAAALLKHFRDLHLPIAHIQTTVTRSPDNRMAHWKQANRWQCEAGTPGHAAPPELAPRNGESIIHKPGFSGFSDGRLAALARENKINTLVIAGVHLHACVRQTALDGYQQGLAVWIIDDAVASDDPVHAAITRRYLEARAMRFMTTVALLRQFSKRHDPLIKATAAARSSVETARKAFARHSSVNAEARSGWLIALADILAKRADTLANAITREIGKPIRFSRAEIQRTSEMLSAIALRHDVAADSNASSTKTTVRRRPHGVVAVITPWNNPVYIALGKIAPAVLYGNSVVWKPAPEARDVSRQILDCLERSGWPAGLVQLLKGDRRAAAELMTEHGVAAVTLTGSMAAGYAAQEICARRHVPLQAELGGNNAAIIWPDADLAHAARCVAAGAFEMAGQRCTANRRVIVHEKCRRAFLPLLQKEAAALQWGDPESAETQIGPLVSAAQRDRVAATVKRAIAQTGPPRLPLGNRPPDVMGHWFAPTILFSDDPAAEIVQEETFGPVLVVQPARDWSEAIRLCNGVRQGLAAAVFTTSNDLIQRFLAEAEAGILKVNSATSDAEVDVPFGGWKSSGIGPPEHGECDRDFFTRIQTVYRKVDSL
jgi:acyl-CoA reductase-like NAD-dependent aldehyde dehydrogenase/nicotinamidase-related amidase